MKENIILGICAAVGIITSLYLYYQNQKTIKAKEENTALEECTATLNIECRYNEMEGCYGTCCNNCDGRAECNLVCDGNSKICGGRI